MKNLEKQLEELIKEIAKDIKQINEMYFGPSSGSTTQNIDETKNF